MGEQSSRIFVTGSLGIENIKNMNFLSKKEVEKKINFKFGRKSALVTIHPETLNKYPVQKITNNILQALDYFDNINFLFTLPNVDEGNEIIVKKIKKFVKKRLNTAKFIPSLGRELYLSTLKLVDFVIGNSSSGIIEAPSFGIPSINVGDRQKSRIKNISVIDCAPITKKIIKSINKSYDKRFLSKISKIKNLYGDGRTSKRIVKIIKNLSLKGILLKKFNDI